MPPNACNTCLSLRLKTQQLITVVVINMVNLSFKNETNFKGKQTNADVFIATV